MHRIDNGHMRCSAPVNEPTMDMPVHGSYSFIRCRFVAPTSLEHPLSLEQLEFV